jgi:hypothetical protein
LLLDWQLIVFHAGEMLCTNTMKPSISSTSFKEEKEEDA